MPVNREASGILEPRVKPGAIDVTGGCGSAFSRQELSEACCSHGPRNSEGAGKPDAGRTREPCVQRECTFAHASNDRFSRNNRHPRAIGLRLTTLISSVRRAFWPPSPLARDPGVDPSIGGSGLHDFAVRTGRVRQLRQCVHRILRANVS